MNYRIKAIDDFLKYWGAVTKQNPDLKITENLIYHNLIRYGIPENKQGSIEDKFEKWISKFEGHSKIDVFVSESWKYFCQFVSKDKSSRNAPEHFKIYIPLDKEHIEEGANQLFEYLSQNDISHTSKIGKEVRFDNIVIRLSNQADFLKIINYVSTNKYIQEGLLLPNPFTANIGNIAVACDGKISYNSTLAALISMYLNNSRSNQTLDNIDVNDFYRFVMEYYNKNLINEPDYVKLTNDFGDDKRVINTPERVVNYMNVISLILKTSNSNFGLMDYFNHYAECSDKQLQQGKVEFITERMKANELRRQKETAMLNMTFINAVDIMTERLKNRDKAISALEEYLRTGRATILTRQNNLRKDICNSDFRERLNEYLINNNIDYFSYASSVLPKEKVVEVEKEDSLNLDVSLLIELVSVMENKYGMQVTLYNISEYLKTGAADKITRTNGLRERVCKSSFRNDLNRMLREKGISLEECINLVKNQKGKTNEDYLNDAILATYAKYDKLYKEGQSKCTGLDFIGGSLRKLILHNKYDGFTRENGVRQALKENVSREEAISIMRDKLNINDGYTSGLKEDELSTLANQYVCFIINSEMLSISK